VFYKGDTFFKKFQDAEDAKFVCYFPGLVGGIVNKEGFHVKIGMCSICKRYKNM
jgi:hypothetical protein